MSITQEKIGQTPDNGRLLRALAEQLKLPLIQILRQTELAGMEDDILMSDINLQADMALRLIDNYLLSSALIDGQQQLELEPSSVSSILYDTAHRLSGIAAQYNCTIDLHLPGKYEPVMVHPRSFEVALTTLGYSFIEAQQMEEVHQKPVVTLAAHRSRYGIVAGVYGDQEGLSTAIYRRAHALYGKARQPLPSMVSSSGAGIFLADSLLNAMAIKLHVSHHHKLNGLAATLLSSSQLSFV